MLITKYDNLAIIIALGASILAIGYQFYFIRRLTEENEMLWEQLTDLIKKKNK
jgi:hypothetical protein